MRQPLERFTEQYYEDWMTSIQSSGSVLRSLDAFCQAGTTATPEAERRGKLAGGQHSLSAMLVPARAIDC